MSNLKSDATYHGGRVVTGGGGYLIGQSNPQLHHPPAPPTKDQERLNGALDAISRVLALIGNDNSFTWAQQSKIIGALNGTEDS